MILKENKHSPLRFIAFDNLILRKILLLDVELLGLLSKEVAKVLFYTQFEWWQFKQYHLIKGSISQLLITCSVSTHQTLGNLAAL